VLCCVVLCCVVLCCVVLCCVVLCCVVLCCVVLCCAVLCCVVLCCVVLCCVVLCCVVLCCVVLSCLVCCVCCCVVLCVCVRVCAGLFRISRLEANGNACRWRCAVLCGSEHVDTESSSLNLFSSPCGLCLLKVVHAFAVLKRAAAVVNKEFGLEEKLSDAIAQACDEVCPCA